jgi:FkbM family methyltransferase
MEVEIGGHKFQVGENPSDFWQWVAEGRYDKEWNLIAAYLRPEHTFLDLGAWVGSHSLFASTIAKRVVAVEPDPVAYEILIRNVDLSDSPIEVFRMAVTGHEGVLTLGSGLLGASTTRLNPNAGGGIGRWEPGQTFEVRSTTLRRFVRDHRLEDPLFIKMDVEGSEEEILDDVEFFWEHKPVLYLEQHPWWWKDETHTRKLIGLVSEHAKVILG